MSPGSKTITATEMLDDLQSDAVPTKADILEDIRQGYRFVMSGGVGQPIDEMHREIAEELEREELTQNAEKTQ